MFRHHIYFNDTLSFGRFYINICGASAFPRMHIFTCYFSSKSSFAKLYTYSCYFSGASFTEFRHHGVSVGPD